VNLGRTYRGSNSDVTYSAYKSEFTKLFELETSGKPSSLMRLVLKSTAARLLAVRQVTQLNAGKKTAGVDGKASLSYEERFALSEELKQPLTVRSFG
jgi:retron-type reverse transcriptase